MNGPPLWGRSRLRRLPAQNNTPRYTLFAMSGGQDAYLADMEGRVCHRWHLDEGISYGFLLDNGDLLMRTLSSVDQRFGGRSDAAEGVLP